MADPKRERVLGLLERLESNLSPLGISDPRGYILRAIEGAIEAQAAKFAKDLGFLGVEELLMAREELVERGKEPREAPVEAQKNRGGRPSKKAKAAKEDNRTVS